MAKKEFYGEVSLVARINFMLEAESEEEAKEKILYSDCPISIVDDGGKEVCEIHGIDWHLVDKARQGNVRESDLDDLYIEESEA